VLALQGCVDPHRPHLEAAGAVFRPVRTAADLDGIDACLLPGGESTTMLRLIGVFGLEPALRAAFARMPVWGVCAGAILMASRVRHPDQAGFGLLDMTVERNAYGRQLDSVQAEVDGYPVSFIRSPRIAAVRDPAAAVLARRDAALERWHPAAPGPSATRAPADGSGDPTWVTTPQYMATTFHPELTLSFPSPMHCSFAALTRRFYGGSGGSADSAAAGGKAVP
jgi:5'-phosphate synthase pdxT subunit